MLKFFLALIIIGFNSTTFAQYASNLNDSDFLINVHNETPYDCQLDDANAIKGDEMSILRPLIHSGESTNFVVLHTLSNAEYNISYRCGNDQVGFRRIAFKSKRNFGFLWAGYVSGQIIPEMSDSNITAIITDKGRGSVKLYLNGYINWSIRYK